MNKQTIDILIDGDDYLYSGDNFEVLHESIGENVL